MRNLILVLLLALNANILSASKGKRGIMPISPQVKDARSVFLTSPSGDEFGMFPLPEDREILIATRKAIAATHRLRFVFDRQRADLVIVVSSRAREGNIKLFDGHGGKKCIWSLSARSDSHGDGAFLAKAFNTELEKASVQDEPEASIAGH